LVTCSCLPVIYCICFLYNYSRGLFRGGRPKNLEESQGIAAATSPSMGLSVRFKSVAGPKFIGFRAIALVLGIHTRRALRRPASCSTTRRAAQVASQATPKVASRAASVSCGALPLSVSGNRKVSLSKSPNLSLYFEMQPLLGCYSIHSLYAGREASSF
jgi:hypothetical protein